MRIWNFFTKITSIILAIIFCATVTIAEGFVEDPVAIEQVIDSVFMLEVYNNQNQQIAVGSGFLAFDEELLVTNYHVIEGGSYVIAVSDDGARYMIGQACNIDKENDIAILWFDEKGMTASLEFDLDDDLMRAEKVVAIGSPVGIMNTVSMGNISGFYKQNGKDWIQFTAPISSGSSGGALLNNDGKVIGVTTATYTSAQNMNMAVKASNVIDLYSQWDGNKYDIGLLTGSGIAKVNDIPEITVQQGTVYVTATGSKYHSCPDCSNMRNPIEMDLTEAIEQGYSICSKCFR